MLSTLIFKNISTTELTLGELTAVIRYRRVSEFGRNSRWLMVIDSRAEADVTRYCRGRFG